jgi:hypothetical protein
MRTKFAWVRPSSGKATCLWATTCVFFTAIAMASPEVPTPKSAPGDIYGLRHLAVTSDHDLKLLSKTAEQWRTPLIDGDGSIVYVANNHQELMALWMDSGKIIWRRNKLGTIGQSFQQVDDSLLVGLGTDLVSLDRFSGEERWRVRVDGLVGSTIAIDAHLAIVPLRPNGFVAVDLNTHKLLWRVKRPQPAGITVRGQAVPTIDAKSGRVYLGFSDGVIQAVAIQTGSLLWTRQLGQQGAQFADIDTRPLLQNRGKTVVVAAYNAGVFGLNAQTGRVQWRNPAFTGISHWWGYNHNRRIIATNGEGQILGFSPQAKKAAWIYQAKRGVGSAVVPLGGSWIGVSMSTGASAILDKQTGAPQQLIATGSGVRAPMASRGQDLVLLSNKGNTLFYRRAHARGLTAR